MSHLPPETFRIWMPTVGYFVVHVADTDRLMRAEMRRCGFAAPAGLVGACVAATSDEMPGLLGVVWLSRPLGAGLVTHELAHAAFRVLDSKRVRVNHWTNRKNFGAARLGTEERYALTLEHLTREFWARAYEIGLVKMEAQGVA